MNILKTILLFFLILLMAGCAVQTRPVLIPFADGEYWVVSQPLVWPVPDSDAVIVVPQGFVTDFASVPRIFWSVFPRHGEYTVAAIVHDFLYWDQRCTREQADNLFELVMRDADVSMVSRLAIYGAVRLGGSSAWEENTNLKASGNVRIIPARFMDFDARVKWSEFRETLRESVEPVEKDNFVPLYCSALDPKEDEKETEQEQEPQPEETESVEPDPDTPQAIEINNQTNESDTVDTILDE